jgi:hypothetical protein
MKKCLAYPFVAALFSLFVLLAPASARPADDKSTIDSVNRAR